MDQKPQKCRCKHEHEEETMIKARMPGMNVRTVRDPPPDKSRPSKIRISPFNMRWSEQVRQSLCRVDIYSVEPPEQRL